MKSKLNLLLVAVLLLLCNKVFADQRPWDKVGKLNMIVYSTEAVSGTHDNKESYLYIDPQGRIYAVISGTTTLTPGATIYINNFPAYQSVNSTGLPVFQFQNGYWQITSTGFPVTVTFPVYQTVNSTGLPVTIINTPDVAVTNSTSGVTVSDWRWLNKSVAGVQADLTASATVYFYGYGTSFLVTAEGGDVYYTPSWGGGQKRVATGTGIGDSGFEVPADSPTYISCVLQAGTTAGVILRGVINK